MIYRSTYDLTNVSNYVSYKSYKHMFMGLYEDIVTTETECIPQIEGI